VLYVVTYIHIVLVCDYVLIHLWLQVSSVMEVWIHDVSLVAISLVITCMDLQCIGRQPCSESLFF
jgi:hypothetical protein